MSKIDFISVYNDRISEINKKLKISAKSKKWVELAKFEAEKADLQNKIKQIEDMHHERE
jgi:hypothetical protein